MSDPENPDFSVAEIKALHTEAHELGIQYNGDDPHELHQFVQLARSERGKDHPVPCFGLSYDPTDRRCRICQIRNACADQDNSPRVEVVEAKLNPIPCDACGKGILEVECLDNETRQLRDYACSTKGCQNSVAVQCGWEKVGQNTVREIVIEGKRAETKKPEKVATPGKDSDAAETSGKSKPPKLRVVRGGKDTSSKSKTPPKVTVTRTKKPAKTKKAKKTKKAAKAKPPAKAPLTPRIANANPVRRTQPAKAPEGLVYECNNGVTYKSLTALVNFITDSRDWSPRKFFKIDTAKVRDGDELTRQFRGETYTVKVKKA